MADKANEPLMNQDRLPRVDAEKGKAKADSYIAATERSEKEAAFVKEVDEVEVVVPVQFVGLTKDELEKYRNDPFWRRLRLFLFVLFWLAWIGMFVVAVLIVVFSPKCPPRNIPEWWQRKVCYQAWTQSFQDADGNGVGDLKGFSDRLDNLRRIGVQTIRPTPLLATESHSGYDVVDYNQVDPQLGTNDDLQTLIDNTHYNDMYFVMDLPLTTTSTKHAWFTASAGNDPTYRDYYEWKAELSDDLDKAYWTELNGSFYFHQKNFTTHPVLRWNNKKVQQEMLSIVKNYLEMGVDGFFLPLPQYFARNADFTESDWDQAAQYVAQIRTTVDQYQNETGREDPILLYTNVPDKTLSGAAKNQFDQTSGLNYMINEHLTTIGPRTCPNNRAECVHQELTDAMRFHDSFNDSWPMWEIGTEHSSRVASRLPKDGELMVMLELMLPGSLNFYYGDEIGMTDLDTSGLNVHPFAAYRSPMQWVGDEANGGFSTAAESDLPIPANPNYKSINFEDQYYQWLTPVKMFRRLAKLRQNDEVLMRGVFKQGPLEDAQTDKVLTFSRYDEPMLPGATVYVGALNFDSEDHDIVFNQDVLPVDDEARKNGMVITITANLGSEGQYWPRKDIDVSSSSTLTLGPKQGIVIRLTK